MVSGLTGKAPVNILIRVVRNGRSRDGHSYCLAAEPVPIRRDHYIVINEGLFIASGQRLWQYQVDSPRC